MSDAPQEVNSAWIRMPQQERARRTVDRVLDAGAELLAERGYDGFSISEVCRRAAVSPGALYDRVDGKDALFLAVHERELERITGAAEAQFAGSSRWAGLSTPELVVAAIGELADQYRREQGLLKAFILRAAVDDRVREEGSRLAGRTQAALVALLLARAADYPHPDPGSAVRTACRTAFDSLSWRTAFGLDFAASDAEMPQHWVEQLCAVCRTYLLTPPS